MCVCLCVSVCVCVCMRVRVNNIYRQIYTYVCVCVVCVCVHPSSTALFPPHRREQSGESSRAYCLPRTLTSTHAAFHARRATTSSSEGRRAHTQTLLPARIWRLTWVVISEPPCQMGSPRKVHMLRGRSSQASLQGSSPPRYRHREPCAKTRLRPGRGPR